MAESTDQLRSLVLISPALDEADREALEANQWALVARSSPEPARPARIPVRGDSEGFNPLVFILPAILFLIVAACFYLIGYVYRAGEPIQVHDPAAGWERWALDAAAVLGATGVCVTAVLAVPSPASLRIARRAAELHGSDLVPDQDLDEQGRDLLARARSAARSITASSVHRDDLLDAAEHEARLPCLLWILGEELAALKAFRTRLDEAARGEEPEIQAVTGIHREAIDKRYRNLETRTAALEDYACEVTSLDRLYRAAKTAEELDSLAIGFEANREIRDAAELAEVAELAQQLPVPRAQLEADLSELTQRLRDRFTALDPAT